MNEIWIMECNFHSIARDIIHLKSILLSSKKVKPSKMPLGIVSMNSTVKIRIQNTGNVLTLKLVYPYEKDIIKFKVSIFSSIGVALFSRSIGDTITYNTGLNTHQVEILEKDSTLNH